ncbi:MAG: hypothetical protein M3Z85_16780 [Acidobacteriota bacterium]|nr:hypothetical protein [Acidobacteriota bacterium]
MPTKKAPTRQKKTRAVVYTLGQGGPSLFDLRLDTPSVILLVNGPGMLFDHLEVLTSLGAGGGATANAWQAVAKGVECIANCSSLSKVKIVPELKTSRVGVRMRIGFGPLGMYRTEMTLRVRKKGLTFRGFFDEIFGQTKPRANYSVVLYPAIAEGHAEHEHKPFVIGPQPGAAGTAPPADHEHHH